MTDYDIHSCGYYCDRHACVLRQRDEMRDKMFAKEWVGLTNEELLDLADMAYANDLELLQTLQTKLKEKNA